MYQISSEVADTHNSLGKCSKLSIGQTFESSAASVGIPSLGAHRSLKKTSVVWASLKATNGSLFLSIPEGTILLFDQCTDKHSSLNGIKNVSAEHSQK